MAAFVDPFSKDEFEDFDDGGEALGDDIGFGGGGNKESTGRWTREEHNLFVKGLELFGKGWKKIANLIKTRTVVQIRTHAQKYFLKLSKARNGEQQFSGTVKRRKTLANARLLVVALPLQAFMKPEVVAYSLENLQATASLAAAAEAASSSAAPQTQDSVALVAVPADAEPEAATASEASAPSPLSESSGGASEEDQEQSGVSMQAGGDAGSETVNKSGKENGNDMVNGSSIVSNNKSNDNNNDNNNTAAVPVAASRNLHKMQADVAEGMFNFLSPHIDLSIRDVPEWFCRGRGLSSLLQDAASLNWSADPGARVSAHVLTNTSTGSVAPKVGSENPTLGGGGEVFFGDDAEAGWFA